MLNGSIYRLVDEIRKQSIGSIDMMRLSIAINALDRAYEAVIYMNRSLSSNDLMVAAINLAYASARYYTAKLWIDLTNLSKAEDVAIPSEDVKAMAMYIDILARNMYAYLISLSQTLNTLQLPQEVNEAVTRYTMAQNVASELEKLALGISSISYMYSALLSLFSQSPEALVYVLNNTVYTNMAFIAKALPIDAVLYLEFVENLSEDYRSQIVALVKLSTILAVYRALWCTALYTPLITTTNTTESPYRTLTIRETVTLTQTITTTLTYTITTTAVVTQTSDHNISVAHASDKSVLHMPLLFSIVIVVILTVLLFTIIAGKRR